MNKERNRILFKESGCLTAIRENLSAVVTGCNGGFEQVLQVDLQGLFKISGWVRVERLDVLVDEVGVTETRLGQGS